MLMKANFKTFRQQTFGPRGQEKRAKKFLIYQKRERKRGRTCKKNNISELENPESVILKHVDNAKDIRKVVCV